MAVFKQARIEAGLSVVEAAKCYSLSPSTVRRLDSGGKMSMCTFAKVFAAQPVQNQFDLIEHLILDAEAKKHTLVLNQLIELKGVMLGKLKRTVQDELK